MRKILLALGVISCSASFSFAGVCGSGTQQTIYNPFTNKLDYVCVYVSGGGGGASTLQVSLGGTQVSSPTVTVNFSSFSFTANQSPVGQANIGINFSSVASQSDLANYLTLSSATATYLQITSSGSFLTISSATANFLTQSSATVTYIQIGSSGTFLSVSSAAANYLTLSSATATYLNKNTVYVASINVTSALTITNNGTPGSIPTIGVNFSSVTSSGGTISTITAGVNINIANSTGPIVVINVSSAPTFSGTITANGGVASSTEVINGATALGIINGSNRARFREAGILSLQNVNTDSADSTGIFMAAASTGSTPAFVTSRRSSGTTSVPVATGAGMNLLQLSAGGYGATNWSNGSTGRMDFIAEEAFTDTSMATGWKLSTTSSTVITPVQRLYVAGNGAATASSSWTFSSDVGLQTLISASSLATDSTGKIIAGSGGGGGSSNLASAYGSIVTSSANVTQTNISTTPVKLSVFISTGQFSNTIESTTNAQIQVSTAGVYWLGMNILSTGTGNYNFYCRIRVNGNDLNPSISCQDTPSVRCLAFGQVNLSSGDIVTVFANTSLVGASTITVTDAQLDVFTIGGPAGPTGATGPAGSGGGASVNVSPHSVLFSTGGTTISGNTGFQYDDSVSSITLGGVISLSSTSATSSAGVIQMRSDTVKASFPVGRSLLSTVPWNSIYHFWDFWNGSLGSESFTGGFGWMNASAQNGFNIYDFNGTSQFFFNTNGTGNASSTFTALGFIDTLLTPGGCVQAGTSGLLTTPSGSACGSGGGGGFVIPSTFPVSYIGPPYPLHSQDIEAGGFFPSFSNGAVPTQQFATAVSSNNFVYLDFQAGTTQYAQSDFILPGSYVSGSTITVRIGMTSTATVTATWVISALCVSQGANEDQAFGSGVTISTGVTVAYQNILTGESAAITPSGSCVPNSELNIQIYRNGDPSVDAWFRRMIVYYEFNKDSAQ